MGLHADSRITIDEFLVAIESVKALSFPPGSAFEYSNTNYFLLREVVERASGQSLAPFASSRIFGPLGMASTRFVSDLDPPPAGTARSYVLSPTQQLVVRRAPQDAQGPSGVHTTVLDLLRWADNFTGGIVGSEAFLNAQLEAGQSPADVPEPYGAHGPFAGTRYAGGLLVSSYGGERIVWHNGVVDGFRAAIAIEPAKRRAVAVTCNTELVGDAFTPALRTMDAWFGP